MLVSKTTLEARKTPVQARSAASVDAIVEATLQVLLEVGKERLTTTRVAARAGVSVGTLYQYFPNKSALLRAVLKRHLGWVAEAVEAACAARKGDPLEVMAEALVNAFFDAKLEHVKSSRAMYAVSDDVDGGAISRAMGKRIVGAIVAMLETTPEGLRMDAEVAALMLQGAMAGISRRMLESGSAEAEIARLRGETIVLARSYLAECSGKL